MVCPGKVDHNKRPSLTEPNALCAECGEEIMDGKGVVGNGRTLCGSYARALSRWDGTLTGSKACGSWVSRLEGLNQGDKISVFDLPKPPSTVGLRIDNGNVYFVGALSLLICVCLTSANTDLLISTCVLTSESSIVCILTLVASRVSHRLSSLDKSSKR